MKFLLFSQYLLTLFLQSINCTIRYTCIHVLYIQKCTCTIHLHVYTIHCTCTSSAGCPTTHSAPSGCPSWPPVLYSLTADEPAGSSTPSPLPHSHPPVASTSTCRYSVPVTLVQYIQYMIKSMNHNSLGCE